MPGQGNKGGEQGVDPQGGCGRQCSKPVPPVAALDGAAVLEIKGFQRPWRSHECGPGLCSAGPLALRARLLQRPHWPRDGSELPGPQ